MRENLKCVTWTLDLTVEFVPSQRRRRESGDVSFNVSLEFHASANAGERPPYEVNTDETDVEDNGDDQNE